MFFILILHLNLFCVCVIFYSSIFDLVQNLEPELTAPWSYVIWALPWKELGSTICTTMRNFYNLVTQFM